MSETRAAETSVHRVADGIGGNFNRERRRRGAEVYRSSALSAQHQLCYGDLPDVDFYFANYIIDRMAYVDMLAWPLTLVACFERGHSRLTTCAL